MSSITKVIQPVVDELGKFGETAKKQVNPDTRKSDEKKAKDETAQLVKDIYKPSLRPDGLKPQEITPEDIVKQQAEDKKKEAELRQALEMHKTTYYDPLVNRPKKPEEQERPQERAERQEKEDRWKLEEKKKKENPIAIQRAAQKTEKYPGASG